MSDKAERREAGRQQFQLRRVATVEEQVTEWKDGRLVSKRVAVPVPYAWCPHRKQVLYSPIRNRKENA
jgi:hypothetical protein